MGSSCYKAAAFWREGGSCDFLKISQWCRKGMNVGTLAAVMNQVQGTAFLLSFASLVQHFPAWDPRSSALQWWGCSVGQCHCSEVSIHYNRMGLKGKRGHDAVQRQCSHFLFSCCVGSSVMSGSSFPTTTWAEPRRCCGHEHLKDHSTSSYKMCSSIKGTIICL